MKQKNKDYSAFGKTLMTTSDSPGISVIIPTFRRGKMVQSLLSSLIKSRQKLNNPVEIIVIDDSPSNEAEQIKKICKNYGTRYLFRKVGVSSKRNFGAKVASYSIILFIDSDCETTPEFLEEHLTLYKKHKRIVAVLGQTKFKGPESFIWKALQFTPFLKPFNFADIKGQRVWGPSNNLSCRKEIFELVGGFDEKFPKKPGGEDVDFGYRLYKEGFMLTAAPKAITYHSTETWMKFGQMAKRLFNWGRGEFNLYYNYNEDLFYDCPKAMGLFLLMIPIVLVSALLSENLKWLSLPVVFLIVNFFSRLIVHLAYHSDRLVNIMRVVVSEILILIYEVGLTYECLKRRWFLPLYHRLIIVPEEASSSWNNQVINNWVIFAQLIISIVIAQLIAINIKN